MENCVPLFVGVKPKDTTKPKIREGRMYYFEFKDKALCIKDRTVMVNLDPIQRITWPLTFLLGNLPVLPNDHT